MSQQAAEDKPPESGISLLPRDREKKKILVHSVTVRCIRCKSQGKCERVRTSGRTFLQPNVHCNSPSLHRTSESTGIGNSWHPAYHSWVID